MAGTLEVKQGAQHFKLGVIGVKWAFKLCLWTAVIRTNKNNYFGRFSKTAKSTIFKLRLFYNDIRKFLLFKKSIFCLVAMPGIKDMAQVAGRMVGANQC